MFISSDNTMLEIFVFESNQQIIELEEIILRAETEGHFEREDINEIFRLMHTIKGSSAMMNFTEVSQLAHSAENLFNVIREGEIDTSKIDFELLCDIILNVTEFIKDALYNIQNGEAIEGDSNQLISKIDDFLKNINNSVNMKDTSEPEPVEEKIVVKKEETVTKPAVDDIVEEILIEPTVHLEANDGKDKNYQMCVFFDKKAQMENLRAFKLVNTLKKQCSDISYNPSDIEDNPASSEEIKNNGFEILLTTKLSKEDIISILEKSAFVTTHEVWQVNSDLVYENTDEIEKMVAEDLENINETTETSVSLNEIDLEVDNEIQLELEENHEEIVSDKSEPVKEVVVPEIVTPKPKRVDSKKNKEKSQGDTGFKNINHNILSVNIDKLDKIMDLIGEISVMQTVIINQENGRMNEDNNATARQLVKLTNELRDNVMTVRLLTVSIIFDNVRRIVREMKRQLGKDVSYEISGENTVLDKKIIDGLFDPIIHIIRNAMDHGIESKEDRIAAGKDPVGKLKISAESSGGYVSIIVTDDGKGLDKEQIVNKSREKGILKKDPDSMTDSEKYALIFEPGFSTKENVSEFSGRGVGMSIVRNKIEELSGNIYIDSELGVGTTFTLKVPLTLAILQGVKIKIADSIFIVSTKSISKTFKVTEATDVIYDTNGNQMILLDDKVYPIIKMRDFLEIGEHEDNFDNGIMILANEGSHSACLYVDSILGEIESIIKPLPKYLLKINAKDHGISGCSKLENGDLSFILDISRIISSIM